MMMNVQDRMRTRKNNDFNCLVFFFSLKYAPKCASFCIRRKHPGDIKPTAENKGKKQKQPGKRKEAEDCKTDCTAKLLKRHHAAELVVENPRGLRLSAGLNEPTRDCTSGLALLKSEDRHQMCHIFQETRERAPFTLSAATLCIIFQPRQRHKLVGGLTAYGLP